MLALAQQIPVEQQPKAVVRVPTHAGRVPALGAIGRHLRREVPNLNLYEVGVTHPAREDAHATLKGARPRILQNPRQGARPARDGARRGTAPPQ